MSINKVAIVGMGALGLLYGEHIQNAGGVELCYIMDKERKEKHLLDKYVINGVEKNFTLVTPEDGQPVDLIIVATKFSGLPQAMEEMAPFVGPNTIIFSVLNGITSEDLLTERFGNDNILHCVVLGMDAVREETNLTYQHKGIVKIGAVNKINIPALTSVCEFFDRIKLPYSREKDILHALWAKLLLNVGINQTCMIYETSYGGAFDNEEARENMYAAMHEVIAIAQAENINLSENDFEDCVMVLRGLAYEGMPSMRQDGLAKRKSEVDLFAGTVVKLGEKYNIPTPVNCMYYQRIKEIEANY